MRAADAQADGLRSVLVVLEQLPELQVRVVTAADDVGAPGSLVSARDVVRVASSPTWSRVRTMSPTWCRGPSHRGGRSPGRMLTGR